MNLQTIEQQILTFLVSVIKTYEQQIAQSVIADLVALIQRYIPATFMSNVIQWLIGMLQTDGITIVQQLLDELANTIESVIPTSDAAMQHNWAAIHAKLATNPPKALLESVSQIITKYQSQLK